MTKERFCNRQLHSGYEEMVRQGCKDVYHDTTSVDSKLDVVQGTLFVGLFS